MELLGPWIKHLFPFIVICLTALLIGCGGHSGTGGTATAGSGYSAPGDASNPGAPEFPHYVTLAWQRSPSSVMGYNVYRGITSGGPYQKINPELEPSTSYTDYSVGAGKKYFYVVTSVDAAAESAYSKEIAVLIP